MEQPMILTEATLQAIVDLQEQLIIIGTPIVTTVQDGDASVVTLNVEMPLRFLRINKTLSGRSGLLKPSDDDSTASRPDQ